MGTRITARGRWLDKRLNRLMLHRRMPDPVDPIPPAGDRFGACHRRRARLVCLPTSLPRSPAFRSSVGSSSTFWKSAIHSSASMPCSQSSSAAPGSCSASCIKSCMRSLLPFPALGYPLVVLLGPGLGGGDDRVAHHLHYRGLQGFQRGPLGHSIHWPDRAQSSRRHESFVGSPLPDGESPQDLLTHRRAASPQFPSGSARDPAEC